MRRLAIALLLMFVAPVWGAGTHSPIPRLLKAVQVGSDGPFKSLLEAQKHSPEFTAPLELRQFLLSQRILRIHLDQGYHHDGSRASLNWWFNEIGVPGKASEVRSKIETTFREAGFSLKVESDHGRDVLLFRRMDVERTSTEVRIEAPANWVGGKETACGFTMAWTVYDMQKSPAPSLEQVLNEVPALRDTRIDEAVYTQLKSTAPREVSLGGTWTRFYSWTITLVEDVDTEGLLKRLGFKPGGDEGSYTREGSYAFLKKLEDRRVQLRIQPQS